MLGARCHPAGVSSMRLVRRLTSVPIRVRVEVVCVMSISISQTEVAQARSNYHQFLAGMYGGFYKALFDLIPHSDIFNRRRLAQGFR